jgi:Dolichyl-phosphate-mannose-protein mannosyltransferase
MPGGGAFWCRRCRATWAMRGDPAPRRGDRARRERQPPAGARQHAHPGRDAGGAGRPPAAWQDHDRGGEWLFGLTPFGWRFAVAVTGSASILMLARIVRRITGSTLLGCIAGLLMALDGLELVLSRTALLDIFVMFWVLAAFGLLIIDRDRTRARVAGAADVVAADVAAAGVAAAAWPHPPDVVLVAGRGSALPGGGPALRSAGGGSVRVRAWARRWPASGTASGTYSRSPAWPSPGTSAPARRPVSGTGGPAGGARTPSGCRCGSG